MVISAHFVHSLGCISGNSCPQILEQMTSWDSISWTVRTNAIVDHGGFLLLVATNLSPSSGCTPAVYLPVDWQQFTMVCIYSPQTACCFQFVLRPVLQIISTCESWMIFLVAALAASSRTKWCLGSCCVPKTAAFDEAPGNQPDLDPLSLGWVGCVSMICCCEIEEEDDNKRIGKS
jgi:hypothetical protein